MKEEFLGGGIMKAGSTASPESVNPNDKKNEVNLDVTDKTLGEAIKEMEKINQELPEDEGAFLDSQASSSTDEDGNKISDIRWQIRSGKE